MLKLYGFGISNYYNMVRHALALKGVAYEDITVYPSAAPDYLEKSPLGKVPCIETEQGFLSETSVILDYIETAFPQQRLSPTDVWGQMKMKELIKVSELYIELQGRRLMPALMMNKSLPPAVIEEVGATLGKGAAAIDRLGAFDPYLMGAEITMADIVLRYSLSLAKVGTALHGVDLNQRIPGLAAWEALMAESEISKAIDAQVAEELPAFLEMLKQL